MGHSVGDSGEKGNIRVYFGEYLARFDDKGRITIPRRFRDTMRVLGHAVWYLTRGFDHSVFLFHCDEWNKIRTQAARHSSMYAKAIDFRRLFFGSVAEARPDGQGRLSVPSHLREHAGLEKDAVLIGVDDHLELWNKDAWRSFQESQEAEYKQMASQLFVKEEELDAGIGKGGASDDAN